MHTLLRPKWVVGHVLVLAIVVGMFALGLWQLDRKDQRAQANDEVRAAMVQPVFTMNSVAIPQGVREFSKVMVTGTWVPSSQVYVRYPLRNGQQGYHVLQGLAVDGGLVVVNRGWISQDAGRLAPRPEVGAAVVETVAGTLRDSERASSAVGDNGGNPPIPTVTTVDLETVGALMKAAVSPMWVAVTEDATPVASQTTTTVPVSPNDPLPLEAPTIDEGPHLSYALQWFSFGLIGLIGWAAVCRRATKETVKERA